MSLFIVGSINMDLTIQTPKMPREGETLIGSDFRMSPGGKGANQAVAIKKSGGDAIMVGCIGNAFGRQLHSALAHQGVNIRFVRQVAEVSSGVAMIILEAGRNRIIIDQGANRLLSGIDVDLALSEAKPGDFLLVQLEIDTTVACHALRRAKQKRMITLLNPAPAKELPTDVFALCDYVLPNQTEAAFYSGIDPVTDQEQARCAANFLDRGAKNVLMTLGEMGSVCFGETTHQTGIYPTSVVDTTAAGDTYIGAFAAELSRHQTVPAAMDFAAAAAALAISKAGAQPSIPTEATIRNFMRRSRCIKK